ncbi:hypothetical protein LTR85_009856 [Meristemomyces frigidus]|nr:hypothetical protein LTR85_009856 [Meristemomyces frigidus]
MGSKKQRAKLGKAGSDASMKTTQPVMPHQVPAQHASASETQVRCYCEACTAPPSTSDNSASLFLRAPREIRDKIYEELLVAKLSPENQAKVDEIKKAESTPFDHFGRQNALEYYDDRAIMPGSDKRYPFIVDALGLLLSNKQIHAEANAVLFSKNTFVILVEWERVHCFWRCERPDCDPPGRPCFIMYHNFLQIKHLEILVTNTRALKDLLLSIESARLNTNLKTIAATFKEAGVKLKTFKIRYTSCFEGQIDAVRDAIEGPTRPGMPERPITLKDKRGKYLTLKRAGVQQFLATHSKVLDPLRHLKGIAEDVKIRGDLPGAYIDDLTKTLLVNNPSTAVKKRQADEDAARQARRKQDDGQQEFWAELMEKNLREGDEGSAKLCAQMIRTSVKGPSFWADFMGPDFMGPASQESMDRHRAKRAARAAQGTVTEVDDEEEEEEEEGAGDAAGHGGGIGVLDGKTVFGPPRP